MTGMDALGNLEGQLNSYGIFAPGMSARPERKPADGPEYEADIYNTPVIC